MTDLESILASHPFFQDLAPRHLKVLAECASRAEFPPGELLCREDQEARQFYLIYHGRVAVEIFTARRGPVTVQTLSEGEVLGWLWFLKPYHWHLDARALELTRAVSFDVGCLLDRCEQDHELGYELMKRYAHFLAVQFRVTKLQLLDMYGV
jgi:CRP/FNR family transcriptional regulator, cyclic AMP receptor protein